MSEEKGSSKIIRLAHGAGGVLQEELIKFITKNIPIKNVNNGIGIEELDDGATIPLKNYEKEIVITADGHTVYPLFFPGGRFTAPRYQGRVRGSYPGGRGVQRRRA